MKKAVTDRFRRLASGGASYGAAVFVLFGLSALSLYPGAILALPLLAISVFALNSYRGIVTNRKVLASIASFSWLGWELLSQSLGYLSGFNLLSEAAFGILATLCIVVATPWAYSTVVLIRNAHFS